MIDPGSVAAATKAIEAHGNALLIEGDAGIQVWHLIISLRHYALLHQLDLPEIIADAMKEEPV